ncbi:hypothetical protein GCM10009733_081920 [Nonomuraea maheshkhaliensis]|uniref:YtxH domain-containing protein n=2 Tax=Streptosporangiaceae TaxID=2004 RepID=A0ABN2GJM1_9ACTN
MVDRAVGHRLDGAVGHGTAAEDPQIAGPGHLDGFVESQHRASLGNMRWWKMLGLAGIMGVAATGVVIARAERRRRAYTPEEIRARLRERVESPAEGSQPDGLRS